MKKNNKSEKPEDKILIEFTSREDAMEFKKIASGRKFCKKGERLVDICEEEIARYEYENSKSIFVKIFKRHKFNKNKEKLMIENRICSNIRAIASECIRKDESEQIDVNKIVCDVKKIILDEIEKYES